MMKIILLLIAIAAGLYLLALLWIFILEHWAWFLLGTVAVLALIKLCMDWDKIVVQRNLKRKPKPSMTIASLNDKHPTNEITTEAEYRDFLASHVLLKSFITKVVGVTFSNDDGTDRQEILSQCLPGEPVAFYWHDFRGSPACAVITDHGQIGHLRAALAADLDIDYGGDEYIFSGHITDITGGFDGLSYGCNIMINIYGPSE